MKPELLIINELLAQFNTLYPKQKWSTEFRNNLIEDITYHTNKIEGMTLSYNETIQFLRTGFLPNAEANREKRRVLDISMIANHRNILEKVFMNFDSFELNETNIKALQKELIQEEFALQPTDIYNPEPGDYKNESMGTWRINSGKTIFHEYPEPYEAIKTFKKLLIDTNERIKNFDFNIEKNHPVTIAADFHYVFLNESHPFADGNGRVCRILTNIILMKGGVPPLIIKSECRDQYMQTFVECENLKSNTPMYDLFTSQLIENINENLNAIR